MLKTYIQCCFAIVIGMMFIASGCTEHHNMIGVYQKVSGETSGSSSIIKLEQNKEGVWEKGIDEISFRWSIRGNEIWLHSKTGGVIIGRLIEEGFIIELPEADSFVFHKMNR